MCVCVSERVCVLQHCVIFQNPKVATDHFPILKPRLPLGSVLWWNSAKNSVTSLSLSSAALFSPWPGLLCHCLLHCLRLQSDITGVSLLQKQLPQHKYYKILGRSSLRHNSNTKREVLLQHWTTHYSIQPRVQFVDTSKQQAVTTESRLVHSMVAYTTAPCDLEMGPEERTVVLIEKKSATGWMWKVSVALLVAALCFAGVLLFAWYWNGKPEILVRIRDLFKNPVFSGNKSLCVYISNLFPSLSLSFTDTFRPNRGANQEWPHWENRWLYAQVLCQIYLSLCGLFETSSHLSSAPQIPTPRWGASAAKPRQPSI